MMLKRKLSYFNTFIVCRSVVSHFLSDNDNKMVIVWYWLLAKVTYGMEKTSM